MSNYEVKSVVCRVSYDEDGVEKFVNCDANTIDGVFQNLARADRYLEKMIMKQEDPIIGESDE